MIRDLAKLQASTRVTVIRGCMPSLRACLPPLLATPTCSLHMACSPECDECGSPWMIPLATFERPETILKPRYTTLQVERQFTQTELIRPSIYLSLSLYRPISSSKSERTLLAASQITCSVVVVRILPYHRLPCFREFRYFRRELAHGRRLPTPVTRPLTGTRLYLTQRP